MTAPTIAGDIRVGKTATASNGTWTSATQFSYQWKRDNADISSATNQTYPIAVADSGHHLTVEVTGWSPLCEENSATSAQTGAVGLGDAPTGNHVAFIGSPKVDQVLTAVKGLWTSPCNDPTIGYQWYRGAASILGSTGVTRTLTSDDWGKQVSVKVTDSCPGYQTGTAQSAASWVDYGFAPQNLVPPTVSGTVAVGKTLTVDHGSWSMGPGLYSYGWYRDGVLVGGLFSVANTYTVTAADLGTDLTVRVDLSVPYHDEGHYSLNLGAVKPAGKLVYRTSRTVKLKGTARVGHTLHLSHSSAYIRGGFSPHAASLRYVWYRDNKAIHGATHSTYKITSHDRHHKVRVRIYGERPGYTSGAYLTGSVHPK